MMSDTITREWQISNTGAYPTSLPEAYAYDDFHPSVSQAARYVMQCMDSSGLVDAYGTLTPPPVEALNFAGSYFVRYSMEVPPRAFLESVFKFIVFYIDNEEPELMFHGITDVVLSEDKFYYQYRLLLGGGKISVMPLDQHDVYKYFPAGTENFNWMLRNPGLKAGEGERPTEFEHLWASMSQALSKHYLEHIPYIGHPKWVEFFGIHYENVLHLAGWALIMWMINPTDPVARKWRSDAIPLFQYVYEHREIVAHGGDFYHPGQFQKLERPYNQCVVCGEVLPCANIYETTTGDFLHFCAAHAPGEWDPDLGEFVPKDPEAAFSACMDSGMRCKHCRIHECIHYQLNRVVVQPNSQLKGTIFAHNLNRHAQDLGIDLQGRVGAALQAAHAAQQPLMLGDIFGV